MKYLPYGIGLFIFIATVLLAPPRTARYSFPRPEVLKRAQEKKTPPSIAQPLIKKKESTPITLVVPPPSVVIAPPPTPIVIADVPIDLRSVVVVKCLFKNASGNVVTAYGSGVMVGREGYVMTARHVVDMAYTHRITGGRQGLRDYSLDSCRIALPPDGTKTPTVADIRRVNPFTLVTEFAYIAQVSLLPPEAAEGGMSDAEGDFVDVALLRITSAVSGALPPSFVISPMKIFDLAIPALRPRAGDEIVSFGFPSGVPSYGNNFYLQGSVGEIKDIVGGDRFFKDQSVGMTAEMETIGGRSGSPVFWQGYVIGVISSKEDYSRTTALSAIFPLARFARDAGIAVFK